MIFFIVIIFSLGSAFLAYGAYPFYFGRVTRRWPTASGAVISAEVKKETSIGLRAAIDRPIRSPDGYHAVVNYKYSVGQKEFQSNRIIHNPVGAGVYFSDHIPNESIKKYHPGKSVTVFYNPKKPEYAILEPGMTLPLTSLITHFVSVSFGLFLILVSFVYSLTVMQLISFKQLGAWFGL
jgi:hypothetical protein